MSSARTDENNSEDIIKNLKEQIAKKNKKTKFIEQEVAKLRLQIENSGIENDKFKNEIELQKQLLAEYSEQINSLKKNLSDSHAQKEKISLVSGMYAKENESLQKTNQVLREQLSNLQIENEKLNNIIANPTQSRIIDLTRITDHKSESKQANKDDKSPTEQRSILNPFRWMGYPAKTSGEKQVLSSERQPTSPIVKLTP